MTTTATPRKPRATWKHEQIGLLVSDFHKHGAVGVNERAGLLAYAPHDARAAHDKLVELGLVFKTPPAELSEGNKSYCDSVVTDLAAFGEPQSTLAIRYLRSRLAPPKKKAP